MTGKIKWRVLASYLIVIFAAMALLGSVLPYSIERRSVSETRGALRAHALLLKDLIESKLAFSDKTDDLDETCRYVASQTYARVTVYDTTGKVIATGESPKPALEPDTLHHARNEGFSCRVCHGQVAAREKISVSVPLEQNGRCIGSIELSSPMFDVTRATDKVRQVVIIILLATAVVALIVGVRLASGIGGPISHMNDMALKMASGDLRQRLKVRSCDEIGQLAASLNTMADHLHGYLGELAQEKSKLEMILTTMADPIIVTDEDHRVTLFNPAAERMFGMGQDSITGRKLDSFSNLRDVSAIIAQALVDGKTVRRELEMRAPVRLELNAYASPVNDQDGKTCGALVVLRDVTEYRRLLEMRKDFVANVSHELRTPVASVRAVVGALQSGAIDDPDAAGRFLGSLDSEIERLSRLLEELLNLSELESGKKGLCRSLVPVRKLAEEAAHDLLSRAEEASLSIRISLAEEMIAFIDGQQFRQVMVNLLDNAIKYTPGGGFIEVFGREADDFITVSVRDTGVGIPMQHLDRIFERFYRVDKGRSRKMGGTGLGLAIVQNIVEAHGGRVMVESEVGQGSTFTIVLPKRDDGDGSAMRPLW